MTSVRASANGEVAYAMEAQIKGATNYFEPTGTHAYAILGRARTVSLNILDFCALRSDGREERSRP